MRSFRRLGQSKPAVRGPSSRRYGPVHRRQTTKHGRGEVPNETFKFQPLANGARRQIESGNLPPTAAPAAVVAGRVEVEVDLPLPAAPEFNRSRPSSELKLEPIKLEELPEYDDNAKGNGSGGGTDLSPGQRRRPHRRSLDCRIGSHQMTDKRKHSSYPRMPRQRSARYGRSGIRLLRRSLPAMLPMNPSSVIGRKTM